MNTLSPAALSEEEIFSILQGIKRQSLDESVSRIVSCLTALIPKDKNNVITLLTKSLDPDQARKETTPHSILELLVKTSLEALVEKNPLADSCKLCRSPYAFIGNAGGTETKQLVNELNQCTEFFEGVAFFKVYLQSGNQLCFLLTWKK